MRTMELIKNNATYAKLRCSCSHIFWTEKSTIVKCPNCKQPWNGKLIQYVRIKAKLKPIDDYTTIIVDRCENIALYTSELFQSSALVFYMSAGFIVEQISAQEFVQTDFDVQNVRTAEYIVKLKAMIDDQPQGSYNTDKG